MKKSVSSKIVYLIGILFVIVLVIVSGVSYFSAKESSFSYLKENQQKVLYDVGYFFEFYSNLKRSAIQEMGEFFENPSTPLSENNIYNILQLTKDNMGFDTVFFATKDGITYQFDRSKRSATQDGFDPRTRPWYLSALKVNEVAVTEPYKSITTGHFSVTYSYAVKRDGEIIGVVAGVYNLEKFSQDVLTLGHSQNSYVGVYAPDGTIMFHEDTKRMLTKNALSQNIAQAFKNDPTILNKDNVEIFIAHDDKGVSQAVMCNATINPLFNICSITQESVYDHASTSILKQQVIISCIAIIAVLILIKLFISYLLKPLSSIQNGLSGFFSYLNHESKNAPKPILVKSKDE
ncbi:PDC sensor domain-containing protein, partial [Helicobacter burdigaliensis]